MPDQFGKKKKVIMIWREETKLSLLTNDITFIENSKKFIGKLELITEFSKLAWYKNQYTQSNCIALYQQPKVNVIVETHTI